MSGRSKLNNQEQALLTFELSHTLLFITFGWLLLKTIVKELMIIQIKDCNI